MPQLLIALGLLGLGWYGLKFFSRASPRLVARAVRFGGGGLAGLVGLLLLVRGRFDLGIGAIGFGLWLAGFYGLKRPSFFRASQRRASGRSTVRSAMIEMELDHATGAMRGTVLTGAHAGQSLENFARPACEALYETCLRDDPEGARLLEAYLDRRFPGWGQAGETQRDARAGGSRERSGGRSGVSEDQAYEILGLRKGATRDEIVRAHRTLMKECHPDHGGTTDLAARVNEAKEILLRRV